MVCPNKNDINPSCYMEIEIDGKNAGQIEIELFEHTVPKTCANFIALCSGENKQKLCYRNTLIHRVIKDFMIQTGDFENGNGTGGRSIYGVKFEDENFSIKHDKPLLLSMANSGKDTNGSQFFITTAATPHLDGIHVVFGRIIGGEKLIRKIECRPTDVDDRPLKSVIISDCGVLVPSRLNENFEDLFVDKTDENAVEIPAVPLNRFLSRGPAAFNDFSWQRERGESPQNKERIDADGVKIKGRGSVSFRSCEVSRNRRERSPLIDDSYKRFDKRRINSKFNRSRSPSRSRSKSPQRRRRNSNYSPSRDEAYKTDSRDDIKRSKCKL